MPLILQFFVGTKHISSSVDGHSWTDSFGVATLRTMRTPHDGCILKHGVQLL